MAHCYGNPKKLIYSVICFFLYHVTSMFIPYYSQIINFMLANYTAIKLCCRKMCIHFKHILFWFRHWEWRALLFASHSLIHSHITIIKVYKLNYYHWFYKSFCWNDQILDTWTAKAMRDIISENVTYYKIYNTVLMQQ